MLIIKAKDGKSDTSCLVEIKGDCESIMNEYRAIIFAVARGIVEPIRDEADRGIIKSELMRMYAEAASNLCKL